MGEVAPATAVLLYGCTAVLLLCAVRIGFWLVCRTQHDWGSGWCAGQVRVARAEPPPKCSVGQKLVWLRILVYLPTYLSIIPVRRTMLGVCLECVQRACVSRHSLFSDD